ncbi:MAG: hypothetical protein KQH63_07845 [Desulfobulbaceae bacterium]|nr:hypothetical protein [Desulfobulbaceae bacterium]
MPSPQSGTVCTADSPEPPVEAIDADVADPGIQTESKESSTTAESSTTEKKSTSPEEDDTSQETHWLAIELKDPDGNAVPNETYKVKLPDGKIITGRLDKEGKAKVERLPEGGECEVTFPRIHEEEVAKQ